MAEHLWELESLVKDAAECLRRAAMMAGNFCTDENTGEPLGWTEMGVTAARLSAVLATLEQTAPLEPIAAAIAEERRHNDDMADQADAASY